MRYSLFVFLTIFSPCLLFSQTQTPLQKFLSAGNLSSAAVGVLICEVQGGEKLVEHNAGVSLNPASLTKLLTTATAVELLTDTFRFQTRIEYEGIITEDSVLNGNIYIVGGGDPTLESLYSASPGNFYVKSAEAIRNLGIRRVNGRVTGDATLFQEYGSPFQWLVEDIGSYYAPAPSALSAHDNIFSLTLQSDISSVKLAEVKPSTRLLLPEMEFKVGGKEIAWRVSKADFSWQPVFRGTIPVNRQLKIRTEMPEPALFVADSLANLLRIIGIPVDSTSVTARMYGGASGRARVRLYTCYSDPLKSIIKSTNYRSINLYAENIFNYLALQKDTVATTQAAAEVISAYWKEKGLPARRIFQSDGSGLSMKNAISADFFVQLLIYMKKRAKYQHSFFSSLPVAGVNGTVASFLSGTALSGKAYVKSGSMERVQNYGGYIFHKNKWYAFCVMVGNFEGDRSTVQKQIGTLLNEVFLF
jgi:D-alanyl-D-alanine carboxypeptidase/D-alanyl-D-alanine-endopeptidase (penicillin-binding protein 4)